MVNKSKKEIMVIIMPGEELKIGYRWFLVRRIWGERPDNENKCTANY